MVDRDDVLRTITHGFGVSVSSSRGCPYRCTFCTTGQTAALVDVKNSHRIRDIMSVADEFEYLYNKFGARRFVVTDDLFLTKHPDSQARAKKLAEEIIRRDLKISWMIDCRVDSIQLDLFEVLARSGLKQIFVGVETGSDKQRAQYQKKFGTNIDSAAVLSAVEALGIKVAGKSAHGNGGKIAYYDHAWTAKIENVTEQKSKRCDPQRVLAEKLEPIVWKAVKDFLTIPEFFTEILLEAQAQSELQTPKQDIERKQNKIYEINMQLDALSERLGLLPKSVNPKHVFDQMERLSVQKDGLEKEVLELKRNNEKENVAVGIADFNQFKAVILDLLENENDPVVKTTIIQKVVHKIIVKSDEVEIFFYVGEKYYKRELAIAGSRLTLLIGIHPFLISHKI